MEGSKDFKKVKYEVPEGYFIELKGNTLNKLRSKKRETKVYEIPLKWAGGIAASLLIGFLIWFNVTLDNKAQRSANQENEELEADWLAFYEDNKLLESNLEVSSKDKFTKYAEQLTQIEDDEIEEIYDYYLSYDEFYDL